MVINIASSHRFHLLDLARELQLCGHTVRFYSYVPKKRALKFGLNKSSIFSFTFLCIPFIFLVRITNRSNLSLKLLYSLMDYYLYYFMKPCDVFIALGTVYKVSLKSAKKKYNAITILEWGSKHIEDVEEILNFHNHSLRQSKYFKDRALEAYSIADYISIPANHVYKTFINRGISSDKIIVNPYGVDIKDFYPIFNVEKKYDLIFVGTWSYTKGSDILAEYLLDSDLLFLHVGSIGDLEFPIRPNMVHVDPVDQKELVHFYNQSKVFVLPSRTEGMAMVQLQALACGLPLVCSSNTGGIDLIKYLPKSEFIFEMESLSTSILSEKINNAFSFFL